MNGPSKDNPISLGALSYACRVYAALTDFGDSWLRFRENVNDSPDLGTQNHPQALLKWLNAWGCRIDLTMLEQVSEDLATWYKRARFKLPPSEARLLELPETDLHVFASLFDSLSAIRPPTARRRFGPTAASKTLFALRPDVFVPWDMAIRDDFQADGTGESYVSYLTQAREDLRRISGQCSGHGFDLEALPERIGRPGATGAQLIGEYYWVTITRKAEPPNPKTLRNWLAWS